MGLAQGIRPDDVPRDQRLHESVPVSGTAGGQRVQAQKDGWDHLGNGQVRVVGNPWCLMQYKGIGVSPSVPDNVFQRSSPLFVVEI